MGARRGLPMVGRIPGGRGITSQRRAGGPPADLPGVVRRRRARHSAHRRSQSPRGIENSHRLHRRHQHGGHRRRPVCQWHDCARDRRDHAFARLAGGVSRRTAAPRPCLQTQTRRPQFSGAAAARVEARANPAAEGLHSRAEAAGDPASTDPAVQQQHGFRPASHSVSRRGDRFGDRQCRADGEGRSCHRDARQHVGAGRVRAGGIERPPAGRWRTGGEPTHQRGACDACGHSHRVRRKFPIAAARRARFRAVYFQPDACDPAAQGFRSPASQLEPTRYFDRAEFGLGGRDGLYRSGQYYRRRRGGGTRGDRCALGVQRRRYCLSRIPGAARHARAGAAAHPIRPRGRAIQTL